MNDNINQTENMGDILTQPCSFIGKTIYIVRDSQYIDSAQIECMDINENCIVLKMIDSSSYIILAQASINNIFLEENEAKEELKRRKEKMLQDERISKDQYYLNIAKEVSSRSTCIRRCYGAVIVNNDIIISTGYNGAPRGCTNCNMIGTCIRQSLAIPAGQRYELCRSVHAEMNAIINASKSDMKDATLYLFGRLANGTSLDVSKCCDMCKRNIINSGIKYIKTYKNGTVDTLEVSEISSEFTHSSSLS